MDDSAAVFILYRCALSKERGSMQIVAATTDEKMLHTIIGAQILGGTMDYRGFSNMKGFEQFRAACRAGEFLYNDLDYGFVEQTENQMLPDCTKEPLFEKAYRLLHLSDREFHAIRDGALESLGENRTHLILDKALSWAAQAAAMLAGSIFGWTVPAADPAHYDVEGIPIRPGERKAPARSLEYQYEQAKFIRQSYRPGMKIVLDEKMEDPYCEMPAGLTGIVGSVDDLGQIHCHWQNGSSLVLIPGVDHFHKDMTQEPAIESSEEQESDL